LNKITKHFISKIIAQVAQLVEQRTENPRVGGSIPPLGTTLQYFNYFTIKYNFLSKNIN
tara:strand:+ start:187 stop:363 length:177 start_codon:yes stop_codon:yes gene_type:complete